MIRAIFEPFSSYATFVPFRHFLPSLCKYRSEKRGLLEKGGRRSKSYWSLSTWSRSRSVAREEESEKGRKAVAWEVGLDEKESGSQARRMNGTGANSRVRSEEIASAAIFVDMKPGAFTARPSAVLMAIEKDAQPTEDVGTIVDPRATSYEPRLNSGTPKVFRASKELEVVADSTIRSGRLRSDLSDRCF
ncbi:hypothetical protein KM043_008891 [Ampulex compressa]|nr:hypothetical protein KM043_008891 [Ampulex compressa]